ncbi:MAG: Stk1 family PASTA domain-containing Ser/Thr kinase [Actinomycetaceae bacterium]|nr:Stk1 family PASTA domain-containing Ser/Thr kinase [Actinomycetaceae bacterium]MDY5855144.1 Stk1 family PASTA domain-containing Ser/Thr kinase [Arcanobacterium sp.]
MKTTDPLLGALIEGRYRIDALLARGGMASVYRGTDTRLQRNVAVKFIHPHLAEQPDFTQRFIREARAAAALSNTHIVSVHDQGVFPTEQGERAYIVMELVEGPDLRSELNAHGSFSLSNALDVTRQVLIALTAAHRKGIVHRDVKPENILLTEPIPTEHPLSKPTFVAKVGDFGLARAVSDATSSHSGQLLGTVAYVAPEIVTRGGSGAPADIYAVGIMLYELIAGRQPFTGESPVAVAYAHVNEPMPRLATLAEWMPAHIDSLIATLSAKDPDHRPADGGAALALVEQAITALPASLALRRIPVFPPRPRKVPTKVDTDRNPRGAKGAAPASVTPNVTHSRTGGSTSVAPTQATLEAVTPESKVVAHNRQTHSENLVAAPQPTATLPHSNAPRSRATDISRPEQPARPEAGTAVSNIRTSAPTAVTTTPTTVTASSRRRSKKPLVITLLLLVLLGAGAGTGYWWFTYGPGLRVQVPAVAGQTFTDASEALRSKGFTIREAHEFSDTVKKDLVIGTNPEGGVSIHPSQPVSVIVSDGVEYLTVPKVVGTAKAQAQATLTKARFVAVVKEEWSQTVPKDAVISQEPAAGKSVPHDSDVTIIVSKGKEPLTVPQAGERSAADFEQLLADTGFEVSRSEEFSDTVPEGGLISISPAPGAQLFRGDTVAIVVSKGPEMVTMPNLFGSSVASAQEKLEALGLVVDVKRDAGNGFVYAQNPIAGIQVKVGSTVTIRSL